METQGEHDHGRLRAKAALITGAASGIGRETALLFAREGAKVAVSDIDRAGADSATREIEAAGGTALAIPMDVTSETAWAEAVRMVEETWGNIDIVVNCAGITDDTPLTELTLAHWRRVLAVNLDGTFLGTATAMKAMNRSGKGSIVNVSSASGVKASPGASAYCAGKAAVIQLTKTAALECAKLGSNIRVNCVVPGAVKTPMWESSSMWPEVSSTEAWNASPDTTPLNRFAHPLEIARAILFLACDESSFVTGSALTVDGGYTA